MIDFRLCAKRPRSLELVRPWKSASHAQSKTNHSLPEKDSSAIERSKAPQTYSARQTIWQSNRRESRSGAGRERAESAPLALEYSNTAQINGDSPEDSYSEIPPISVVSSSGQWRNANYLTRPEASAEIESNRPDRGVHLEFEVHNNADPFVGFNGDIVQADPEIEEHIHFAKLLRRVSKLTDDVLMRRTQWRHEYEQLKYRRGYLSSSTEELMGIMKLQSLDHNRVHSVQQAHTQIEPQGQANNDASSEEMSPSPSITNTSGRSSGEEGPKQEHSSATGADTDASDSNAIAKLYSRYKSDHEAVTAQEEKTTRLGDELSNLEYHLDSELQVIKKRMQAGDFISELRSEIMREPPSSSEMSAPQSSEAQIPDLVAKYFDVKGDIGIYHERLQDLDFAHAEGETERNFLRERGDPVVPPDDEFNHNYRTSRRKIENDLQIAQNDAEILRQRCQDAGLNPDDYRTSRPSMYPASTQPSGRPISDMFPPPPQIHELHYPPLPAPVNAEKQSTRMIDNWLKTVDPEEPDHPPAIESTERSVSEHSSDIAFKQSLADYELKSFNLDLFRFRSTPLEDYG